MATKPFNSVLERMGFTASLTFLGSYLFLVGAAFFLAGRDRMIPAEWWETGGGNHGPWRHYQPVRTLLSYAILVLLGSMFTGGYTAKFLGSTRAGVIMLISQALLILDFIFLFWLTD